MLKKSTYLIAYDGIVRKTTSGKICKQIFSTNHLHTLFYYHQVIVFNGIFLKTTSGIDSEKNLRIISERHLINSLCLI